MEQVTRMIAFSTTVCYLADIFCLLVLKACANVFCADLNTPEFVKQVFEQCCEDGQVSFGVCYQLRQAAVSELYRSLIPVKAYNSTNGHFSIAEMPSKWTRNVRERRAREAIDRAKANSHRQ